MSGKLYNPIVITGPSGSGKTELIDYVEKIILILWKLMG